MDTKYDLILVTDFESTGLPEDDCYVLEVASIMVNLDLREVGRYNTLVWYDNLEQVMASMDAYVHDMHTKSGLIQALHENPRRMYVNDVNTEWAAWVNDLRFRLGRGDDIKPVCMAGSGVSRFDRPLTMRDFPDVYRQLFYRELDVSPMREAFGLASVEWPVPQDPEDKAHRGIDDCDHHLNELRGIRDWILEADLRRKGNISRPISPPHWGGY